MIIVKAYVRQRRLKVPDPIKTISVRMEAWLHKKIRLLAAGKEQSVGAWIREAIMEKIEREGK